MAAPALAADVTSVQAPKRVKAGASATIVASVDAVSSCRLTAGRTSASAAATGADRVTFTFTVSRAAKPRRYTLTLRCAGAATRPIALTVTRGKGRRGTSSQLVKGRIKVSVRRAASAQPQPAPTPPCCKPAATPTPEPGPPPVENAFRAVYALAADQAGTPGYVEGIVATIDAVNGWFATQSPAGIMPRWLRDVAGRPEVSVVRLARPAAEYEGPGGFSRMYDDLQAVHPLPTSTQRSVVWMEVRQPGACASTSRGIAWMTEKSCNIKPVSPTSWPFDATYVTAHELVHLFGAVPDCAPHADGTGHVTDDPRDILYAGARDFGNLMLDPGRDDYFGTNGATCTDIATSPLWDRR